MKEINVGTLNVRGCRESYDLETICNDIGKTWEKPIGRHKETWMSMIKNSLRENELDINFRNDESMIRDLEVICADRQ